jgi:prepilin-type N-terminal cleavage/methylation domain-containing protein
MLRRSVMASGLYPKLNNRTTSGFTLIELLTVIAIIALLAAIIFPVFAVVRENARQSTSIANLHDISAKLEQYKLDKHQYPDVLFGYAYPPGGSAVPMDKAYDAAVAAGVAGVYFPGLYPEYVRDVNEFQDPDNAPIDLTTSEQPDVNTLSAAGILSPNNTQWFYRADAYDISPQITGTNQVSSTLYLVRYQRSWSDLVSLVGTTLTPPGGLTLTDYKRQLRWQFPPANSYITATTYHVQNSNKVIVLWENGSAKSIDASRFDDSSTTIDPASQVSQANFWKVLP